MKQETRSLVTHKRHSEALACRCGRDILLFLLGGVLLNYLFFVFEDNIEVTTRTAATRTVAAENQEPQQPALPKWVTSSDPHNFAEEIHTGSLGLTDKVDKVHLFQYIYQPNLSRLIQHRLASSGNSHEKIKIRMLEIGLGCAKGGGMIRRTPGGSALGWRHLFQRISGIEFDLHIMEYDETCALKWAASHQHIAVVHTGDASSEQDLERVYQASGGIPFDVIIDDASHINWHQIKTLDYMLHKVSDDNGFYVVEDIGSSCGNWAANMGRRLGPRVGGTSNCMTTTTAGGRGETKTVQPTILAHLQEYQRCLVGSNTYKYERADRVEFLKGVTRVEIHRNAALLSKEKLMAINVDGTQQLV